METVTVNLRRSDYDVYIGRSGRGHDGYFGNPFSGAKHGGRAMAVKLHRDYFFKRLGEDTEFARRVEGLRGKKLGCFCAPLECHGDTIAGYLNGKTPKPDTPSDSE